MDYTNCAKLVNNTYYDIYCESTCGLYCRAFLLMCFILMCYVYGTLCCYMCKRNGSHEEIEELIVIGRSIKDKPPKYEEI